MIKKANNTYGIHLTNYYLKDEEKEFKDVKEVEKLFLNRFKQLKWEFLKTIYLKNDMDYGGQGPTPSYNMIFEGNANLNEYDKELLTISYECNFDFKLYDFSSNYYQNYSRGEYDSGSISGGYAHDEYKQIVIDKKIELGLKVLGKQSDVKKSVKTTSFKRKAVKNVSKKAVKKKATKKKVAKKPTKKKAVKNATKKNATKKAKIIKLQ
jgi:hypothetical protein